MSSPLTWFRKKQKLLLGVFGVLLMFAFTISLGTGVDPIMDYLTGAPGGSSTYQNETVVSWNGGTLSEAQFDSLRAGRSGLIQFLSAAWSTAISRGGSANRLPPIPFTTDEESLLRTHLLARWGREMGIVVTDDAVNDFLEQLTDRTLNGSELSSILRNATRGRVTQDQMFELLRTEILAQRVAKMAQSGFFPYSPVAAWDYHNRLHRRVKAELMGISVADYIAQIPDPDEDELQSFFDRHKNRYRQPGDPTPGFRQRKRIAFRFVRADFNQFLDAEVEKVTDEEVQRNYDENKDKYRNTQLPQTTDSQGLDVIQRESGVNPSDLELQNNDPGETAPPSAKIDDEVQIPSADSAIDAEATPSRPSDPLDPNPSIESPRQQQQSQPTDDGSDSQLEGESTNQTNEDSFSAFSVAAEQDASAQDASEQDASAQDEQAGAQADSPNLSVTTSAASAGSEATQVEASAGDDDLAQQSTEQAEPEFKPLEEVQDEIRRALSRERAQAKMDDAIRAVRSEVRQYSKDRIAWRFTLENEPNAAEPSPPDFVEILSQYAGLAVGKTPLVDRFEIENYPIGAIEDGGVAFSDIAFGEDTTPYQPRVFPPLRSVAGDNGEQKLTATFEIGFVFWKTDEKESRIPELKEVRDQVIRAWKMLPRHALKLAMEEAQRNAAEARESDSSLQALFGSVPNRTFFETDDEISWMSPGSVPYSGSAPQPSTIAGVENAGHEFRAEMFRLAGGDIGVATNESADMVYVIRMISATPDDEALRQQFLTSGTTPTVQYLAMVDNQRAYAQWYSSLVDELGVQWNREPYSGERDAP